MAPEESMQTFLDQFDKLSEEAQQLVLEYLRSTVGQTGEEAPQQIDPQQ